MLKNVTPFMQRRRARGLEGPRQTQGSDSGVLMGGRLFGNENPEICSNVWWLLFVPLFAFISLIDMTSLRSLRDWVNSLTLSL